MDNLKKSEIRVQKAHNVLYLLCMKYFSWSNDKNAWLKEVRNVSFEQVVYFIEKGMVLDIVENPNQDKYENQRIYVVAIDNYAYLVPFIESETEIALKTIIPSRKATQKYLRGN